jgi:outer membrane lipoprotein-sorting protein
MQRKNIYVTQSDSAPDLSLSLNRDLTGYQNIKFVIGYDTPKEIVKDSGVTITNAGTGSVKVEFASDGSDLDQAGVFPVQIEMIDAGGKKQTVTGLNIHIDEKIS